MRRAYLPLDEIFIFYYLTLLCVIPMPLLGKISPCLARLGKWCRIQESYKTWMNCIPPVVRIDKWKQSTSKHFSFLKEFIMSAELLPWQLNFPKNRAVWRKWANWHVAEFTRAKCQLEIFSKFDSSEKFSRREVMCRSPVAEWWQSTVVFSKTTRSFPVETLNALNKPQAYDQRWYCIICQMT